MAVILSAPYAVAIAVIGCGELSFHVAEWHRFGTTRRSRRQSTDTRVSRRVRPRSDTIAMRIGSGLLGVYTVTYRVLSADGHPVSGAFVFGMHEAPTESAQARASRLAPDSAAGKGVERGTALLMLSPPSHAVGVGNSGKPKNERRKSLIVSAADLYLYLLFVIPDARLRSPQPGLCHRG